MDLQILHLLLLMGSSNTRYSLEKEGGKKLKGRKENREIFQSCILHLSEKLLKHSYKSLEEVSSISTKKERGRGVGRREGKFHQFMAETIVILVTLLHCKYS